MTEQTKNILIITGAASCVIADINAIPFPEYCAVDWMAIGLDAVDKYLWRIQYFATYHPVDIAPARERRREAGGNTDYKTIAHVPHEGEEIDLIIPFNAPSGSSALLGVLAGLKMGYRRMILCGCPLEGKNAQAGNYETFRPGWEAQNKNDLGKVRSMSGWTRLFLGAPTEEWLTCKEAGR